MLNSTESLDSVIETMHDTAHPHHQKHIYRCKRLLKAITKDSKSLHAVNIHLEEVRDTFKFKFNQELRPTIGLSSTSPARHREPS